MLELQSKILYFSLYWLKCCKMHFSFKALVLPLLVRTKLPSTPAAPQGWFSNWWSLTCSFCGCLTISGTSRRMLERFNLAAFDQCRDTLGTSDGDGGLDPKLWGERFEFPSPLLCISQSERTWVHVVLGAPKTWPGCYWLHLQLRRAFTKSDCGSGSDAAIVSVQPKIQVRGLLMISRVKEREMVV